MSDHADDIPLLPVPQNSPLMESIAAHNKAAMDSIQVPSTATVNAPGMTITLTIPKQASPDHIMSGDEALKFTWDKYLHFTKKGDMKLSRKWFDSHMEVLETILRTREEKK